VITELFQATTANKSKHFPSHVTFAKNSLMLLCFVSITTKPYIKGAKLGMSTSFPEKRERSQKAK